MNNLEKDMDRYHDQLEEQATMREEGIESMKNALLGQPDTLHEIHKEVTQDLDDNIDKAFTNPTYLHALLVERLTDKATEIYDYRWSNR